MFLELKRVWKGVVIKMGNDEREVTWADDVAGAERTRDAILNKMGRFYSVL